MSLSRYLDLFLAESKEHLAAACEIRAQLENRPPDPGLWRDFMRHAHSLKGMAAAMNYRSMVTLTHAVEELAERLEGAPVREVRGYLPLLSDSLECLDGILNRIEGGQDADCPRAEELGRALRTARPSDEPIPTSRRTFEPSRDRPPANDATAPARWRIELDLSRRPEVSAEWTVSTIGRIAGIGRVVESSPPSLAVAGGRTQGRLRLVLSSHRSREEIESELESLMGRDAFTLEAEPSLPPGPAAESRSTPWIRVPADKLDGLFEGLLELRQEQGRLQALMPDTSGPVRQQLQRSEFRLKEVYGTLLELRLVPFGTVAERLRQCVRELARELGREVQFEIVDGHVRLDRRILEALVDPLMHALKNALDHGLEPADERRAAGKPPRGTLRLHVTRKGERVRITVQDDGRGMRADDLRRTAVRLGLLQEEEAAALTDSEALMLTTLPRFTTRRKADHLSGRGIGLDVVRHGLVALGGRLQIRSTPGHGSELRLWVPSSHALIQTLLVRSAGEFYALPIDTVLQSVDLHGHEADDGTLPERIVIDERNIRVVQLSDRLNLRRPVPLRPRPGWALVLVKADSDVALVVDEVIGRKDLVVQPFPTPLSSLREYSGAAVLEDGTIALVLDALYIARPAELRKGTSAPSDGSDPSAPRRSSDPPPSLS